MLHCDFNAGDVEYDDTWNLYIDQILQREWGNLCPGRTWQKCEQKEQQEEKTNHQGNSSIKSLPKDIRLIWRWNQQQSSFAFASHHVDMSICNKQKCKDCTLFMIWKFQKCMQKTFLCIASLECRLRQFLLFLHLNYALPFPCVVLPREGLGNLRY